MVPALQRTADKSLARRCTLCRRTRHICCAMFASSFVPNDVTRAISVSYARYRCSLLLAVEAMIHYQEWVSHSTETGAWFYSPRFATVTSQNVPRYDFWLDLPSSRKNRHFALDCCRHQYSRLAVIHIVTTWRHRIVVDAATAGMMSQSQRTVQPAHSSRVIVVVAGCRHLVIDVVHSELVSVLQPSPQRLRQYQRPDHHC